MTAWLWALGHYKLPRVCVNVYDYSHEAYFFNSKGSGDDINAWIDRWPCLWLFTCSSDLFGIFSTFSCFMLLIMALSFAMFAAVHFAWSAVDRSLKYTSFRYTIRDCLDVKYSVLSCLKTVMLLYSQAWFNKAATPGFRHIFFFNKPNVIISKNCPTKLTVCVVCPQAVSNQ